MLWNDFVPGDIFRRNINDNKARSSETVVNLKIKVAQWIYEDILLPKHNNPKLVSASRAPLLLGLKSFDDNDDEVVLLKLLL